MVNSVEDMEIFKKAHKLTLKIYELTNSFPKEERYGLISQIRRAASSINANLMEGSHRNNRGEYRQFAGIANGSAGELKYHLLLSKDLGYLDYEKYKMLRKEADSISKMLRGLIKSLTNTNN